MGMSKFDERMACLEKRATWLKKRIREAEDDGRRLTYDSQELDALEWALDELDYHDRECPR